MHDSSQLHVLAVLFPVPAGWVSRRGGLDVMAVQKVFSYW
jgi:hypothetical protein